MTYSTYNRISSTLNVHKFYYTATLITVKITSLQKLFSIFTTELSVSTLFSVYDVLQQSELGRDTITKSMCSPFLHQRTGYNRSVSVPVSGVCVIILLTIQ